jgi:hypothetical protein
MDSAAPLAQSLCARFLENRTNPTCCVYLPHCLGKASFRTADVLSEGFPIGHICVAVFLSFLPYKEGSYGVTVVTHAL